MPLTPLDIHNKEFSRRLRGYDEDEVNEFLDQVIKDYEGVIRENKELSNREVSFYRGREQGDEQGADTKEDTEQIQHGTALVTVKIGDENVGTSVQSASAEAKEERGETGGNK